MTNEEWLKKTKKIFESASLPTSRLDAELLLCDALNKDRAWVLAHPENILKSFELNILDGWIQRRAEHEPMAYIRGKQEFYGRDFYVSPATLTPRPETETLVERALEIINKEQVSRVADIGTGSGCIVITLQLESQKNCQFTGYEISKDALSIAQKNVGIHNAHVTLMHNDITADNKQPWSNDDLIVANLPYVPTSFKINLAATHEPDYAIYGGDDGLDYYRHLFSKVGMTQYVITESLPPQHEELALLAFKNGYIQTDEQDLIQVFKRR